LVFPFNIVSPQRSPPASITMQPPLLSQTIGAGPSHITQTNLSQPSISSQTIDISTIPFPQLPHGGRKFNLSLFLLYHTHYMQ
jgi:hypothetical protein